MKMSISVFMKIYNFFAMLFFIFGTFAILIGGPALIESYEITDPQVISSLLIFRIVVIYVFGVGFVISSFIFIIMRRKGIVAYKRIIDRLSSDRSMGFNLNLTFPETDEFGNLGRWLNKFIARMREFDRIKVERLRAFQQKISYLAEAIDKGLLVISGENKISYVNSHFMKLLNIRDKSIVGLPVNKVIQDEQFLNALNELKNKPKNQVLDDLRFKVGDVSYKTKVNFVPIITSEVELIETLVIFDYITKKVLQI